MESTLAGWASALFSYMSDAAQYCIIIAPYCSPGLALKKGGRSFSCGFTSRSILRSDILAISATPILKNPLQMQEVDHESSPEITVSPSSKIRGYWEKG